jgi:SAM-dependent methyltransferase
MSDVADFFDEQSEDYYGQGDSGFRRSHSITARRIESALSGRVLSVGGVWNQAGVDAGVDAGGVALTVIDISPAMLRPWKSRGFDSVQCDARAIPFADASFDHLVFPLVLHHMTDGSAGNAQASVGRAVDEAHRVLRDGGQLWISEFSLPATVYWLERFLAPATRALLSLANIPLVVMHTAEFYARVLAQRGFEPTVHRIEAKDARPTDLMRPVIGLPWLRVPRMLYPLRTVLVEGTKT